MSASEKVDTGVDTADFGTKPTCMTLDNQLSRIGLLMNGEHIIAISPAAIGIESVAILKQSREGTMQEGHPANDNPGSIAAEGPSCKVTIQ